jgi:tRNA A-37 threonylcarbamoyl transferase component Bud32
MTRLQQWLGWMPRHLKRQETDPILLETVSRIAHDETPDGWRILHSSAAARVAAGTWKTGAVHLKVFMPRSRFEAVKALFRGSRGVRAVDRSIELARDGFSVPTVLVHGWAYGGHEFMVTGTVQGAPVLHLATRRFGEPQLPLRDRRALLRDCGREIARLHRAGWVHGDLRLSNVLFGTAAPNHAPRLWFLDNEGCRRTRDSDARLRNLVQMAMIDSQYQGRTDRMRLFQAYANELGFTRAQRRRRIQEILNERERRWQKRLRQGGPKARHVPRRSI